MKQAITWAFALSLAAAAMAGCNNKSDSAAQPTAAGSTATVSAPVNKNCAVMQDHEADNTVTAVHNGKTYAFCCEDCITAFKKNPEKFANAK